MLRPERSRYTAAECSHDLIHIPEPVLHTTSNAPCTPLVLSRPTYTPYKGNEGLSLESRRAYSWTLARESLLITHFSLTHGPAHQLRIGPTRSLLGRTHLAMEELAVCPCWGPGQTLGHRGDDPSTRQGLFSLPSSVGREPSRQWDYLPAKPPVAYVVRPRAMGKPPHSAKFSGILAKDLDSRRTLGTSLPLV
jgi:hypothetical protein